MKYILQGLKFLWKLITNPDVYRFTLRTLWLFFPSFIFLFLCWVAFWNISQGKDLMVYTIEHPMVFIFFFIAILFFAFTIWYSSRLVAKAKFWQNKYYLWLKLRVHMPRLLGFTSFTIIILAFLQLKIDESPQTSRGWAYILFLLSIPYYYLLDYISYYLVFVKKVSGKALWLVIICLLAVCMLAIFTLNAFTGLIAMLLVLQLAMVVFFIFRRRYLETSGKYAEPPKDLDKLKGFKFLVASFRQLFNDPEEKSTFKIFNYIAVAAFIIYIIAIARVDTAVFLGSFPFIFLAFGVLVGFINFISTVSVFSRFNFHIIYLVAAFIFGNMQEPHKVGLVKKENPAVFYSKRQVLKEYFSNWVKERFKDSVAAGTKQPVYFVLSDGGASRSGYWVASVLSRIEDSIGNKFSDNLFCLSGASGGSVGNAAFYNLLRFKKNGGKEFSSFQDESKAYLGSDFLSYTLARMLGPDFFRYVFFPFLTGVKDRADALTTALEKVSDDSTVLDNSFSVGMSSLITQTGQPANLPIFCVNTTRMQDGAPAVISTINMNERFFNKRVDVLTLLSEEEDLKLSSAVVLGASFPYVSPAGRIDKLIKVINEDSTIKSYYEPHYFVDGGYFDNSGAGVVNEMIIAMRQMLETDAYLKTFKDKLDFFVLHMTNDPFPGGDPILHKINPLVNDLAAPLQTMVGSYASQTSINDSRLKSYMLNNFGEGHYIPFNLYKVKDKMSFSMNWVISKRTLDSMNTRLEHSAAVAKFINDLKPKN